jgi:hypothetical protein
VDGFQPNPVYPVDALSAPWTFILRRAFIHEVIVIRVVDCAGNSDEALYDLTSKVMSISFDLPMVMLDKLVWTQISI